MRRAAKHRSFVTSPVVQRLRQTLMETRFSDEIRRQMQMQIQCEVLSKSEHMDSPGFRAFHPFDLKRMVQAYDHQFLGGACYAALNGRPLSFRLAPRLTRAGGKTTWRMLPVGQTGQSYEEFEISVSSHLLFQTFRDEQRQVTVVGLPCSNRLEAMQRIVEHELVHLCEKLAWDDSSCKARRFQEIAHRLFGHQEHTHQLVTTAEIARTRHGIRPGSKVSFLMDGRRLTGFVNKLTKRATVLVVDPCGRLYSDGRTYTRYYVPLDLLTPLE